MTEANDEMLEGYFDGFDIETPEPSENRTAAYRHGFKMGRDDALRRPSDNADFNRIKAELAMREDAEK